MTNPVDGPLNGVRILDLTHVWAGPLAVRMLADLGAEVVRVEAPTSRGPRVFPSAPIGGWLSGSVSDEPWNDSALFVKLARNRRSLALDLKTDQGRAVFLRLVTQADVLVENFSARAMPSLGLDSATLQRANPQLIYLCMPGYGASGPLKDRVAFGPTVEVMCGFTNMMGYGPDEPRNTAMALMDPVAAANSTAAVLTALRQRQQQGNGMRVEMSLHEGGVSYNGPWLIDHQLGQAPTCMGNRHPQMAPHGVYRCVGEDEWLALACADDRQWQDLCRLLPGLDASLDLRARQQQQDDIDLQISAWTSQRSKHAAAELLQQHGVPAGAVNNVPDMVDDPQVQAREFFVRYERYDRPMPGNPIHMPGLDSSQWSPCPRLGEHNAEVLGDWLGLSDAEIAGLQADGVIVDKPPA
ncbi:MAG: CoA transferase [Pseudomonadota bacterium]